MRRGEGEGQGGTVAEPPGAMRAAGGLCRQVPADAAASQFSKPRPTTLPLVAGDGTQPPPGPLVKSAQHRWSLAEAEVGAPSFEIARQFFDDLREAAAAGSARQFPALSL